MAEQTTGACHDFENPPLSEVVCWTQFKPLENLLAPHFGSLWEVFRSEYPQCREVAPLELVIEQFGEPSRPRIELLEVPPLPRIWFIQKDDTRIMKFE